MQCDRISPDDEISHLIGVECAYKRSEVLVENHISTYDIPGGFPLAQPSAHGMVVAVSNRNQWVVRLKTPSERP